LALTLLALVSLAGMPRPAQAAAPTEAIQVQVEAAYLYKFASYVEWPASLFASPRDPIVVGIFNAAPLAAELRSLTRSKSLNGRSFVVRRIGPGDKVDGVHILFVGAADAGAAANALESVRDRPVLTVSDSPEAFANGSMINFVVSDERLRFDVAMRPMRRSGLRLSALMLTAANRVDKDGP
jgi:hypothetical protein